MNTSIINSIDAFIRKFYLNQLIKGIIIVAALSLVLFLTMIFFEYFNYSSSFVRALMFWSYIVVTLLIVIIYIIRPALKYFKLGKCISYQEAAVIIGQFFPEVKDKLLNLLQLQDMSDVEDNQLLSASIRQKTLQLSPIPFSNAISFSVNKKYLKFLIPPFLIFFLLLLIFPSFIYDSSERLINYNTFYQKPAPFQFLITNDSLVAFQQHDFLLNVSVEGTAYPDDVYVVIDDIEYKMQKHSANSFSFLFAQLHHSIDFQLKGASVFSSQYHLSVIPNPSIIDYQIVIAPPLYTAMPVQNLSNQGDIIVPQGTLVKWSFLTRDVDSLCFIFNNKSNIYVPEANGKLSVSLKAMQTSSYAFFVVNNINHHSDTLQYTLSVIPDAAPLIAVAESKDSILPKKRFFHGRIKDDYGFSQLQFVVVKTNTDDTSIHQKMLYPLSISAENTQEFYYSLNIDELHLMPGDNLQYYFVVWDNDAIHGPKSTSSQYFSFSVPSVDEIENIIAENFSQVVSQAQSSISELQSIQKEIDEIMQKLVNKNELSWQDKKQLQDLLDKQNKIEKEIKDIQQQLNESTSFEQDYLNQNEQIIQKQDELNKLFNEVLSDEVKKMMSEIDKLINENEKKNIQEKLENLKVDNEQLEKQIDQDISLLKQLELEKKVESAVQKAEALAKEQNELSQKSLQSEKNEQQSLLKEQNQLSDKFQQLKNDIRQIQQDYKNLDNNNDFKIDNKLLKSIDSNQSDAYKKLEKGKNKDASKSQKSAAEEMQSLSNSLAQEQMRMEQENLAEDAEMIRRLLKSLVTLSFHQESLISSVNTTFIQDPKYQNIIFEQNKIKADFGNIEDSLQAIAKRQITVASAINKDIGNVNTYISKALQGLLKYNQSFYGGAKNNNAASSMQYTMTAINNLALVLAESLDNMQNQMRQNSQQQKQGNCRRPSQNRRQGSCNNPGNNKPSVKSMKQLQEELNKQMESLKKEMEKNGNKPGDGRRKIGEGNSISEEFAKMAAQQQMIRKMMQEYGQQLKQQNANNTQLFRDIESILNQMDQTETDLINKTISQQTMMRQKQILTRMLEHEKADMQREKDNRRQSHEAVEQYRVSPSDINSIELLKKNNSQLFHVVPPSLTPFYKSKVNSYFYQY